MVFDTKHRARRQYLDDERELSTEGNFFISSGQGKKYYGRDEAKNILTRH
jgi:hypothetical protein